MARYIRNPFEIHSESIQGNILKYNIAEIKRIWKLDHTGVKCPFHKGKKNGKCPDMTCGDCEMAELFTESETETDNEEA